MSEVSTSGAERDPWRSVLRDGLADQVRRHASADALVRKDPVRFAEWASVDAHESESARRSVEPDVAKLRVRARQIGDRRGRVVALCWSIPAAVLIAALAVLALIVGLGGW